ncbi:HD-GYP domain-containing protein [Candidatus Latescibacterota bacterium]
MNKFIFSVHPQALRVNTVRTFDVFVENEENNLDIFHRAGEKFTPKDQGKIFKLNITTLFVRNKDRTRFFKYLEANYPGIVDDPLINQSSKAEIIHSLISFLSMSIFESPTAELLEQYMNVIAKTTDFIMNEDDGIKYLIRVTSSSYNLYNHVVNVGIFGMGLAKEILGVNSKHNMANIAAGLFLHDIGRYTIPKHINQRNGPLSPEEWNVMKKHPEEGFKLLKKYHIDSNEIKFIVYQHHERHNGSGYPSALKGDEIHPYSKICAISDTFDALTSNRPYRSARSSFNALGVMQNEMKGEFDPQFFARFVKLFSKA